MNKNEFIDGVEVLGLTIQLYGERTDEDEVDLGSLTLERDGREYILDVCQSCWIAENGETTIEVEFGMEIG